MFIYTACDSHYFEEFGRVIVRSIQRNTTMGIHLHLYNPTAEQVCWCESQPQVSITYEHVDPLSFVAAAQYWQRDDLDPAQADQLRRTHTAMQKGHDQNLVERLQKTYYACARFIRLQQCMQPSHQVLAIDSDAVVRSQLQPLPDGPDFYIHYISGRRARYLAGGIYLPGTSTASEFMTQYAHELTLKLASDHLYWGLDQDVLEHVVPNYQVAQLPMSWIDWEMRPDSAVWTAKGQRKELEIFIREQQKYAA